MSTQTFSVNGLGGQEYPFDEQNPGVPNFLLLGITPPGVTLPGGEAAEATLKGELMEIS